VTVTLVHSKTRLALHTLREGDGRSLLLLHGLGERSATAVPAEVASWPGPIHALDFTGHGASSVPIGGGYTAEVLMADADTALLHLGEATVHGRGLGAYVALLVAGARPDAVIGAILDDGPGLAGGGPVPASPFIVSIDPRAVPPPDPYALAELSHDVRPPDYATSFVRQATQLSPLDEPIAVVAASRAEWLQAVAAEPGVRTCSLTEALDGYAGARR
jgi:pimeloyl-ACP methyl ester carboxylesterase